MKGRDKEFSTQDSFSAYLKTAVKNTKIKYIKRHIKTAYVLHIRRRPGL